MHKISNYKKKEYILSFGTDDVLYIDLDVNIHKEGDQGPFRLEILDCPLSAAKMEFACHLITKLHAAELKQLVDEIKLAVTEELTPSLFTLFYAGEILPDEPQSQQAS